MKLSITERKAEGKCHSNRLRKRGFVPAVLYVRGKESLPISVDRSHFDAALRSIPKGRLSTTIFSLADEKGKEIRAIVKEIQYHPTSYDIIHLDFEELQKDVPVNIKVPIECIGVLDCAGIKLGGVLRRVIRYLKVSCLPDHIPPYFELDVTALGMKQYKKLSDLQIPKNVKPLVDLGEVAVVIAKR